MGALFGRCVAAAAGRTPGRRGDGAEVPSELRKEQWRWADGTEKKLSERSVSGERIDYRIEIVNESRRSLTGASHERQRKRKKWGKSSQATVEFFDASHWPSSRR